MAANNMRCGPPVMSRRLAPPKPARPRTPDDRSPAGGSSADPLQTVLEARSVARIELGRTSHGLDLRRFKRSDDPCRSPQYQRVLRKFLAFGDHRTGTDDTSARDRGPIHDDRAHAAQRAV